MALLFVMIVLVSIMLYAIACSLVFGHNTIGPETTLKHKFKHYMPQQAIKQQEDHGVAYSIVMDLAAAIEQPDNWDKIESISVGHKRVTNFRNQALQKPVSIPQRQERPQFKIVK
ncbi:hypothetical protein [Pseudoalteromonas sp. S558]|uniref:hypothetical protein n=1 Tax=Pseudoalteromonas sp. S558 TaxID=2066515 RepID=UPI00110B51A1|nr:hypothetical protein [Pseudoalteromonas sp. S558]TMO02898.1 hypothetical protein CWB66_12235 [Pseudoalteromonas sp. S558]